MLRPALAFALLLAETKLALAAPQAQVSVDGCPPSLSRGLDRFVAIELEPLSADADQIDVQVGCSEDTVELLVAVDGQSRTRTMDLRTISPSVRARVVALTAAELVRELGALPPPPPPELSPAPVVDRPAPAPAPPRTSVGELEAFFQGAQFELEGGLLIGGGLRFAYTELKPWRLALDFGASTYQRSSDLGSARLVLAGLGARAGGSLPLDALWLELGGGARVGVARISGSATSDEASAASVAGAWSAPFAFAGLDAPLGGSWRLGLDAEIGYVLLPVHGRIESGDDIEVDGLWTALALGLAVEL